MEERLTQIEARLQQYNELLAHHIRRTELLEEYVKRNDVNWRDMADRIETVQSRNQKFTIKLLAGVGTFVGIFIPLFIKLLGAL